MRQQAGSQESEETDEIEITPEMVEAGVMGFFNSCPSSAIPEDVSIHEMVQNIISASLMCRNIAVEPQVCNEPDLKRTLDEEIGQRLRRDHDFEHRIRYLERNLLPAILETAQARPSKPEIEVTPEMIEAGLSELLEFSRAGDVYEDRVVAIFKAMIRANSRR